ncbi:DUF7544 domain-containing protein [Natronosalvus vescus]|uniref:DUF7544 domain-containing protein n=1 Tax=Natronosalvus vescus TaxID=2953881 RepID=UPI0020919B3C|nr:hypothetical protein [Natronosalvus vescus]
MYAIDNLGDAIDVTRDRLTPIEIGTWLKLAIILLFVGGATVGGPGLPASDGGTATGDMEGVDSLEELEAEWNAEFGDQVTFEELLYAIAILVVLLIGFGLIYALIAAIMEFTFIESLRSESVHLRRYFNQNLGRGLRLFGFRIGLFLAVLVPLAVPVWYVISTANGFTVTLAVLGGIYALTALVLGLLYVLISRFTTIFVTQVMLLEDRGVLSAWKRFFPTLRGNLAEYGLYVLLVWILQVVVNFGFAFLAVIAALVVVIPFAITVAVLVVVGGPALYLAVAVGALGLLTVLLAVMLIRVPIDSYFRYYGFLLLGDTNPELDLIPERRAAVRRHDGGVGSVPEEPSDGDHWDDDSDEETGQDDHDEGTGWDTSSNWDDDRDDDEEPDDDRDDGRGW